MNATNDSIARLAEYRLARSLTFEILAAEMSAAGFPINPRALNAALTNRLRTQPRDTTLYKIARFVETIDGAAAAPARKPAPRSKPRKRVA